MSSLSPAQRRWLWAAGLFCVLYLMYSSIFTSDYLLNDESACIGYHFDPLAIARSQLLSYGRWLHGLFGAVVYDFVGLKPFRAALVRFANFAALAAAAVFLLRKLDGDGQPKAFLIVLLLFSQRAIQGAMGYSLHLITGTVPAIWLSLAAFHLHFFKFNGAGRARWLERSIVLLLFLAALQSSQTYAYFAMIPLAYGCLSDWSGFGSRAWSFIAVAAASLLIATFTLAIGLHVLHRSGAAGYELAEHGMSAVAHQPLKVLAHALDPRSYWSVFTIWTYPFPFDRVLPTERGRMTVALAVMALWAALIATTIYDGRREGFGKWWALCACVAFGAVLLVADSPDEIIEHRPHVATVLTGVVLLSGVYAWSAVTRGRRSLDYLAAVFVVLTAFGAQANVAAGIVEARADQLKFIRTELMSKPSARKIIVVAPDDGGACIAAPCSPWMGMVMQGSWHETRLNRYQYALATLGIDPRAREIVFASRTPSQPGADELVIDWQKFVDARVPRAPASAR